MAKTNPASAAKAAAAAATNGGVVALQVSAKRESYYSAGITTPFTYEPRVLPVHELSEDQIEELLNDPYLVVKTLDTIPLDAEQNVN